MTTEERREAHAQYTEILLAAVRDGKQIVHDIRGFDDYGKAVTFDPTARRREGDTDGWSPWTCTESGQSYTSFEVRVR